MSPPAAASPSPGTGTAARRWSRASTGWPPIRRPPCPATINGEPPLARITRIHAVLRANASPELRDALDAALASLPDPATRSYDQLLAALAAR